MDGVVVIDFFFDGVRRVGVVFEQVGFPVENGIALVTVHGADKHQVDIAFAESLEHLAVGAVIFCCCIAVFARVLVELDFGLVVAFGNVDEGKCLRLW